LQKAHLDVPSLVHNARDKEYQILEKK